MNMIFVHGRAQGHRTAEKIQKEWESALQEGLLQSRISLPESVSIRTVFYGQVLDTLKNREKFPRAEDIAIRGQENESGATPFEEFLDSALHEIVDTKGIDVEDLDAVTERGLRNQPWVLRAARAIDKSLTVGSSVGIEAFLSDVYAYVRDDVVRAGIHESFNGVFRDEGGVVVAHSLGSVVAYRALLECKKAGDVTLITLGSPLAIRAIRDRLEDSLRCPNCVKNWINFYDAADIVSLYPLDADNFNITPPIKNIKVVNHSESHHDAAGYLENKEVARAIHAALTAKL